MISSESSEKALFRIIDGSPVAMFVINSHHEVIHWNTAMEVLTGIKKADILGTKQHRRAFFDSDKPILADLIIEGIPAKEIEEHYQGKARKSALIEGAYEAEDVFPIQREQVNKWLRFTASPIKDDKDKIIGAIETLEDITERKNAEAALRNSEHNYRSLFESALDAIWVSNEKGNIQATNEAASRLTGYSIQELEQTNLNLILAKSSQNVFSEVRNTLLRGQPMDRSYEQTLTRKDGSEVTCMVSTNLIIRNGVKTFLSIFRDVTEKKRQYENQSSYLKEITRAQEEERKRIARELHDSTAQNLIAILHQIENLLDEKITIPVSQAKKLWAIYEHIRDILQEVRRFSRNLRPSILDDLGLLPALDWLNGELKSNYGIETILTKKGEERRLAPEAELLLFRIVQETMANVVKHARAIEAEVKVEFTAENVIITVIDNGIGFSPPKDMGDLVQIGKLGLAGIAERVQLLGGKLNITSEAGKGSTIQVEAPI